MAFKLRGFTPFTKNLFGDDVDDIISNQLPKSLLDSKKARQISANQVNIPKINRDARKLEKTRRKVILQQGKKQG
tara:strand:- start:72 stop:296 length:225 start_codon:yes stop_codon:yes gene_type:complete